MCQKHLALYDAKSSRCRVFFLALFPGSTLWQAVLHQTERTLLCFVPPPGSAATAIVRFFAKRLEPLQRFANERLAEA